MSLRFVYQLYDSFHYVRHKMITTGANGLGIGSFKSQIERREMCYRSGHKD